MGVTGDMCWDSYMACAKMSGLMQCFQEMIKE